MTLFTLFLGLISTANAGPTGHDVQYELSTIQSDDSRWDMVGSGTVSLRGLRSSWRVADNINVTGGWRYGSTSNNVSIYDGSIAEEEDSVVYESGPQIGLNLHQISVGAKYTWAAKNWLQPYGSAAADLSIASLMLDDDTDSQGNANELSFTTISPGASATVGVEVLPFLKDARFRASVFAEAGYQLSSALGFEDDSQKDKVSIGELPLGGTLVRAGIGVRF